VQMEEFFRWQLQVMTKVSNGKLKMSSRKGIQFKPMGPNFSLKEKIVTRSNSQSILNKSFLDNSAKKKSPYGAPILSASSSAKKINIRRKIPSGISSGNLTKNRSMVMLTDKDRRTPTLNLSINNSFNSVE
jgi:hypothetical protein